MDINVVCALSNLSISYANIGSNRVRKYYIDKYRDRDIYRYTDIYLHTYSPIWASLTQILAPTGCGNNRYVNVYI